MIKLGETVKTQKFQDWRNSRKTQNKLRYIYTRIDYVVVVCEGNSGRDFTVVLYPGIAMTPTLPPTPSLHSWLAMFWVGVSPENQLPSQEG